MQSGVVRIGESEFEKVSGEWSWTFCYLNDETIEAINKELGKAAPSVRTVQRAGSTAVRPGTTGSRPINSRPASSGVTKTRPR